MSDVSDMDIRRTVRSPARAALKFGKSRLLCAMLGREIQEQDKHAEVDSFEAGKSFIDPVPYPQAANSCDAIN